MNGSEGLDDSDSEGTHDASSAKPAFTMAFGSVVDIGVYDDEDDTVYEVSKYRWVILISHFLCFAANSFVMMSFAPIS